MPIKPKARKSKVKSSLKKPSRKLPPKHPIYLVKAMWRNTALKMKVQAKNETLAWDKAWWQVARMLGGMDCLEVRVIGRIE